MPSTFLFPEAGFGAENRFNGFKEPSSFLTVKYYNHKEQTDFIRDRSIRKTIVVRDSTGIREQKYADRMLRYLPKF
jgi:hypothetical protein